MITQPVTPGPLQRCHLRCVELEIGNVEVFFDVGGRRRAWHHSDTFIDCPAKQDLRHRLVVLGAQPGSVCFDVLQVALVVPKRAVGGHDDTLRQSEREGKGGVS